MEISVYFIDFIVFSFIGWVYETIYCTVQTKHWQNRGFLYGPICPIYGTGAVAAVVIFSYLPKMTGDLPVWKIFLICLVGSAILEYTTAAILEDCFHAVWWDYSNVPLNFRGRICLPASIGFGVAGVLIVRYLIPLLSGLHQTAHPLANEAVSLIMMLFFGMDLALTIATLSDLLDRMEQIEKEFNEKAEAGVALAQKGPAAVGAAATMAARKTVEKAHLELAQRSEAYSEAAKRTVQKAQLEMAERSQAYGEAGKRKIEQAQQGVAAYSEASRRKLEQAQLEMSARIRSLGDGLNRRQKYHLSSVKEFRTEGTRAVALRLRDYMMNVQKKLGTPQERAAGGEIREDGDFRGRNDRDSA